MRGSSWSEQVKDDIWFTSESGHSLDVGGTFIWATSQPKTIEQDLPSVVMVGNADWTDEELALLRDFSGSVTANYDKYFKYRMGANLLKIWKCSNRYCAKKLTWEMIAGKDTLQELLDLFKRDGEYSL